MPPVSLHDVARDLERALDLLDSAVRDCPGSLWESAMWPVPAPDPGHQFLDAHWQPITDAAQRGGFVQRWVERWSTPWSVAWHALETLDYDLHGESGPWSPPPPFAGHPHWRDLPSLPAAWSHPEIRAYIHYCRQRVRDTLASMSDEKAAAALPPTHRYGGQPHGQVIAALAGHTTGHASQIRQFITRLPARIETARLVLRQYEAADVHALDGDAIRSVDHIGRFMPHARAELLGDRVALIADARRAFDAGERFAYGMFLPDGTFVGNCGAHWTEDGVLNIGYWVLLEHLRQGYATEAVRAMTRAGFEAGVRRFVLNCHPANAASIGVARSSGFTYLSTDQCTDGDGNAYEEMTWELLPEAR